MKSQNEPNSSLHHQLLFNLKYLSTSMKFHKIMKTKKNNYKLVYITKMGEEVLLKLLYIKLIQETFSSFSIYTQNYKFTNDLVAASFLSFNPELDIYLDISFIFCM